MAPNMPQSRVPTKDYYQVLGIQPNASLRAIRYARNELALKYHPDKNPGNAEALARFKEIQEAFEVLSNLATRDWYDSRGPSTQDSGDFDALYDEIDQRIWNQWHYDPTGVQGASYAQQTQESGTERKTYSTLAEGPSKAQQARTKFLFVTSEKQKIGVPKTPKKPGFRGANIYMSSDEEEDAGDDVEDDDPFVDHGNQMTEDQTCDDDAAAESRQPSEPLPNEDDDKDDQSIIQSKEQDNNEQAFQLAIEQGIKQESDIDEDEYWEEKTTSIYTKPKRTEWFFEDYFEDDLSEKPFLINFRRTAKKTRDGWRNACRRTDHAKVDTKYYNTKDQKAMLDEEYARQCQIRQNWANVLRIQEANLKEHENIARDRLRARKAQMKKDAAQARKARTQARPQAPRRSARGRTGAGTRGRSSVFKKRSATFWNESDESESEWTSRSGWKP